MDFLRFFTLLSVLVVLCKAEGGLSKPRSGRKYDTQYGPPGNYMDNSSDDSDDDSRDDSGSAPDPPASNQPSGPKYGYPSIKGYPSYDKKGYPFINPYYNWKGFTKGFTKGSDAPAMNVVEMMMMMDAMDQIKEQEKSGLSKFLSDSKSVLMASVVPLSLILAAVVPVLLNYSMTGQGAAGATPTVSSTAGGSRGARGVEEAGAFERIVRNFEEMARAVDEDDCLQRALCRVASNTSATLGPEVRRVAASVAGFVGDNWADGAGLKGFVSGLKQSSCEDVCEEQGNVTKNVIKY